MAVRTGHPRHTHEACADGITLAAHVLSVDVNGDPVAAGGSGGQQYTEDAAAAANPIGTVPMLVRADTPGALVTGDGDNVGQRGTNYGAAYVTLLDTSGAAVSVGGGTQYDRDVAAGAADKMTMAGGVRKDTPVSLVGADNDRTMAIYDANGRMHAIVPLPSGAATESTISALAGDLGDSADVEAAADGSLIAIQKRIRTQITAVLATAGATSGAAVITDANGTLQQYLRGIVKLLITSGTIVLGAGAALIGKVGIDQTTPGTTNQVSIIPAVNGVAGGAGVVGATVVRTTLASDDPAVATLGATTGAAVVTDANGTLQQYLRGIVKLLITSGTIILGAGANLIGYVGGKNTYGGKQTALTITNFTSLANGSGWQSAAITTTAKDVHLHIQTKGQASGTNYLDFYVAEILSDGTVYTDAATGSEGTFTAAGRLNSRYLGSIKCNATTATQGSMKLSDVYGVIPSKFALIAINNTGAAMSATGGDHIFQHEFVN